MACLAGSPDAGRILEHATAIAALSGARLTAIRVMPTEGTPGRRVDPVDWDIKMHEEYRQLRHLSDETGAPDNMRLAVVGGRAAHCICEEARNTGVDLTVLGAGALGTPAGWGLGGTARHVAECFPGSVLIVPAKLDGEMRGKVPARRIVVPLDGSPHSEGALRIAVAIATNRAAELVLLHAVPEIALSTNGPPDPEDEALRDQLRRRNERSAKTRLERMRRLIPADKIRSRVRLLSGQEPRRALMRAICEENCEMLVLSARGLGGDPDLPIGSTADYLISHAVTPVLLVRSAERVSHRSAGTAPSRSYAVRDHW